VRVWKGLVYDRIMTLDNDGLTLCVVRWNPLTMALQSNRDHHMCKSSVIMIPNACNWIIEFSVNCLYAIMWIIVICPCMTYYFYVLNGLNVIFCILAYSCTLWSCVIFLFCDDYHFGGSIWICRFSDTSERWEIRS